MTWLSDKLAAGGQRPYPVTDLVVRVIGQVPAARVTGTLARRLGMSRGWVGRCRTLGLTERQADHWATRLGFMPYEVWADWGSTDNQPPGDP